MLGTRAAQKRRGWGTLETFLVSLKVCVILQLLLVFNFIEKCRRDDAESAVEGKAMLACAFPLENQIRGAL